MPINLGIRLVVIFPTLLFLIGCCLRSIIERNDFRDVYNINKDIGRKLEHTFLLILSIDSIFLFLANALIIIFEFESTEIGIIVLIFGVLVSICLLITVYTDNLTLGGIGIFGIFGLLCGELSYFIFKDSTIITIPYLLHLSVISGFLLGFFIGYMIIKMAVPFSSISSE